MAVTVNTSASNVRSDFMISDAAIPQRVAEQNTQAEKFEEMLAKADGKLQKFVDIKKAFDEGKYDVPTVEELKKAGIVIDSADAGENPKELAEKIVSGEVSIDDIPKEEITPQLLKEVAAACQIEDDDRLKNLDFAEEIMLLTGKLLKRKDDDENADETADMNVLASLLNIDVSDEIAQILKALTGEETDGGEIKVEAVNSEDMEIIDEIIENHVNTAQEFKSEADEVVFEENVAEAEIATAEEVTENVVETDVVDVTPKLAETNVVEAAQKPAETNAEETAPKQVEETNAVEAAPKQAEANVAENKAVEATAEPVETNAVEAAPKQAETTNAAEAAQKQTETEVAEQPKETVLKSETAEILKTAVDNGEISKPEVRTYKAEKTDVEVQETPAETSEGVSVKAVDERAKALGEELEMLKNAKQKPEAEPKTQDDLSKVRLLHGNITESTVILRKDSGEMIVVSQKDFVSQIQKLVEQVVKENNAKNEYSLMLNPEELGKITVKMTKAADGAVSVTIVAENARTQRLLEQNSELIQHNLRNNGMNLENWQTVNESQQNHAAQDYRGSAKNPYYAQENNTDEETDENGKSFADIIAAM